MNIDQLVEEHGYTVNSLAKKLKVAPSTLSGVFKKNPNNWKLKIFHAVSIELGMEMDSLYQELLLDSQTLSPFIKWVGGKRQLLGEIDRLMPSSFNTYYEPFIGGGAVFLHLLPQSAVINDLNFELINAWQVVQETPTKLLQLLEEYKAKNSKEFYLNLRASDRDGRINKMTAVERAARFIYMNKTGFNGLYRVNSKGENNVPYGRYKNPNIVDFRILEVSKYLKQNDITILNTNFVQAVESVKENDFVYFDPPYIPVSPTAAFTSYTSAGFNIEQQKILKNLFFELTNKGVKVMLSNSDTKLTRELYKDANIHRVQATRMVNSKASNRGSIYELIITNY